MIIADLHIHSRFSRATSKEGDTAHLDLWARRKGIHVVGTGDFTHPEWRKELNATLIPAEEGLYCLKENYRLPDSTAGIADMPRFMITGEISSIYKKNGKTRKVHSVLLLPSLEAAEMLSKKLEAIGNIHSDGRPILGLDCRDLLEITLDTCPEAIFIPAHIWTPHFSLFGAFSGFDSIEECFEDLTPYIHALETGLSSDPPMNWRLSALDGYQLVSNSDAHSPSKLGREATLFETDCSYPSIIHAIQTGEGLWGTIEFFPEEGKYHYDGHRKCHVCLSPSEAESHNNQCPVCGKRLTPGVDHRVDELADRNIGFIRENKRPFESLVPLPEVIAAATGHSAASVRTQKTYFHLLESLGPEFIILRETPIEAIKKQGGYLIAEGIRRLRAGDVQRFPGYDGAYGTIKLFEDSERNALEGQLSLLDNIATTSKKVSTTPLPTINESQPSPVLEFAVQQTESLNDEQKRAVITPAKAMAVIAGPGTGKTKTLTSRIHYLLKKRNVPAGRITAVTFTKKAASEMRERLASLIDKRNLKNLTIGTFHAICYTILKTHHEPFTLIDDMIAANIASDIIDIHHLEMAPKTLLKKIAYVKNGDADCLPENIYTAYQKQLRDAKLMDFDDLLLETLKLLEDDSVKLPQRHHFDFLLVDEFQDISPVQYRLIQAMHREGIELFVIGDPDQAIYGFRGADAHCFERLASDYPSLVTIRLQHNYRSTPQIIESAQAVINHNAGDKRWLTPALGNGPKLRYVHAPTELSEGIFVAQEINRIIGGIDMLGAFEQIHQDAAVGFGDIAILYRTHHQAEIFEKCLAKEGIPYIVIGREDFLNESEVHGAICFFKKAFNSSDYTSAEFALKEIWQIAPEHIPTLLQTPHLIDRSQCSYPYLLEKYSNKKRTAPKKLFESFYKDTGIHSQATDKLIDLAAAYHTMDEFFETLSLGEEGDFIRTPAKRYSADTVTLMTLHGSKGLEFPVVFLSGVRKGVLPLEVSSCNIEEERRLFYVGMTRAKHDLILTASGTTSSFVKEIPDSLLIKEEARPTNEGHQLNLLDMLK